MQRMSTRTKKEKSKPGLHPLLPFSLYCHGTYSQLRCNNGIRDEDMKLMENLKCLRQKQGQKQFN